jgi:hypothetical protein
MRTQYKLIERHWDYVNGEFVQVEDLVHIENVSYELAHAMRRLIINDTNINDLRVLLVVED